MSADPLIVSTGWFPDDAGGLPRYVRGLAEALAAAGAEPRVLAVGPATDAPPWVTAVAPAGSTLPLRLLAFRRAAAGSRALLDAHFALYALPVLLGRRGPLVVHFHGPWAEEADAAGDAASLGAVVRAAVERVVYRRADAVVTLSAAFAELVCERYGVDRARVHTIPPGVDLERFSPGDRAAARARLGLPPDAFVAVAARRLVPRMGLDVLLDAWTRLELPGAALLVAGEGPQREELEGRAVPGVRFAGKLSDDDLVAAYRAADVVVLPSRGLEGFGLAALEALACGTPVVASETGGLPEALAGLPGGCLVPPGDVAALASRLGDAAAGARPLPDEATCRAHAERFAWAEAARRHLDLYAAVRARRPRVVFLDHTAVLAGGEVALLRTLPALDVDAHVILATDGPLADALRAAGIAVEVLPLHESARDLGREHVGALGAAGEALRSLGHALRLARRLRELRPDAVHANSLKANLYGGLAARLARVPVVWHVRDRLSEDYLEPRALRIVHAAERLLADAVVVDTETVRATLARPARAVVIPSPVPPAPPASGREPGPLHVGIVGRIAPWKGQDVFLDAFAQAFPDGEERAVVVGAPLFGADEEAWAAGLEERARELGIGDRVEFRGFREDVAAELARLDVLVHASVIPEPFGLVVVEGMAAGLPVVAADAGGPAETVEDGVAGILYPPGDAAALAAALRDLAGDPERRRALGEAGRERAAAFAPERVAARLREVYEGLR
ncbi:MAG TPA: glycosyltransferase family 4 protein [Gaiellaceae bacterium]|nr:glycosyltransferase family 4 protein [Gaiellaceae bacterium]